MLHACNSCGCYYRADESACPHCASARAPFGRASAAILLGLGLALGGCDDGKDMVALYGVPDTGGVDADGDGWTLGGGDCDDSDNTINPDATETPGDGIDSNCDEADDT